MSAVETDNATLNKKYSALQLYASQLDVIKKQIETLESQLEDVNAIIAALDEFSGVSAGSETLVNLAPGIYAKARLLDTESLVVNVGADVVVEKNVRDTRGLLLSQFDELTKLREGLIEEFKKTSARFEMLQKDVAMSTGRV